MQDYRIIHGYADMGLEDYTLTQYAHVTRATLDPEPNGVSSFVQADLSDPDAIPERPEKYDLGLFQPPCNRYADPTSISGDPDEWPDLIDEARAIAEKTCEHWIIENKPKAWDDENRARDPTVVLEGKHFGEPVKYERAFETSFPVKQPKTWGALGTDDYETSPFFDSEKGRTWWATYKGVPPESAAKGDLSRNVVPASYLRHLLRAWQDALDAETGTERADYSDYDDEMDTRRAKAANRSLEEFGRTVAPDGGLTEKERKDDGKEDNR